MKNKPKINFNPGSKARIEIPNEFELHKLHSRVLILTVELSEGFFSLLLF